MLRGGSYRLFRPTWSNVPEQGARRFGEFEPSLFDAPVGHTVRVDNDFGTPRGRRVVDSKKPDSWRFASWCGDGSELPLFTSSSGTTAAVKD
jgi:hypothetical protein